MTRIAFVTCRDYPTLTADDRLTIPPLEKLGIKVSSVMWDDPAAKWAMYDAVVVRSPWDYPEKLGEFREWLARMEAEKIRIFNPVDVMRANLDKRYLRELANRGLAIVPTLWTQFSDSESLRQLTINSGWKEVVVKPAVSAGARETYRVAADAPLTYRAGTELMVQPFLEDVAREGEWSLLYFNGAFSHAVLKRPRGGDFRVQEEHGGSTAPTDAPAEAKAIAESILATISPPLLYARVDLVRWEGQLKLIELELVEPALYLAKAPGSPERFAAAVKALF